jgi:DNA-binding transcriptional LysR family regulator
MERGFVVLATDYVATLLGGGVDRWLAARAPRAELRLAPNTADDAALLRDGGADLAVGIYGELPPEMRTRALLTDRFVCVVRRDHPTVGKRLSLEHYVALPHVQIAPRGQPGGYIDDVLRARGLARRVARALPYFLPAMYLVAQTDYVLTISERVARAFGDRLGLRIVEVPVALRPYALSLVWHPRLDGDPGHRLVREGFIAAAREAAGDQHPDARTRLDATDATSGQRRRRMARRRAR